MLRHVVARILNDRSASDIAKEVEILQAISWVTAPWKEVDDKFAKLFKELTEMNEAKIDFRAEEYVAFDNEISSFHPPINSEMVD